MCRWRNAPSSVVPPQQYDSGGVETPGFDLSQCKTGEDANNIVQYGLGSQPSTAEGARSEHAQLASRARAALLLAKRALTDVAGLELIACRAFRTAARQLEQHVARVLA